MVSGLASCGWLLARGRSMFTACFITGTVIMKMMSSTSMTSTRGVMLISFITSSVSSWVPKATSAALLHGDHVGRAAAGRHPGAGQEVGMQVVRETVELHDHGLV